MKQLVTLALCLSSASLLFSCTKTEQGNPVPNASNASTPIGTKTTPPDSTKSFFQINYDSTVQDTVIYITD